MDDVQLVKACQQGDIKAFDALYKKYCSQALRTAYLLTMNRHLAEEIVQERNLHAQRSSSF